MSNDNFILTQEDEQFLTKEELQKWAHYDGDHDVLLSKRAMARKLLLTGNQNLDGANLQIWLNSPIDVLNCSQRLMNVLRNCELRTVRDVYEVGLDYLMRKNNFGQRCRDDLVEIFRDHGLIMRAKPTAAPLGNADPIETDPAVVTVTLPLKLLSDMVNACHHNLAHYERQHGRFASRGSRKPEHDRLLALVDAAERLIREHEERN
ncbi:hypothetical protein ACEOHC_003874 [Salmonella enterica]